LYNILSCDLFFTIILFAAYPWLVCEKKKEIEYCANDLAADIVPIGIFQYCTQLWFLLLVVVTGRSKLVCKLFLILRTYHSTACRFLMKWLFGPLRWNNRRTLPACVYNKSSESIRLLPLEVTTQKSKGTPIRDKQCCKSKNCEQQLF